MDRVSSSTDPLTNSATYSYDNDGNLTSTTDRNGQTTGISYDALNRPDTVTYDDASTQTYTFDAGNRLTQLVDSLNGTISDSYDTFDQLTEETTPQGTVDYTYDTAGRRTSMTVAGQAEVDYSYDDANRVTQITQGSATVSFDYDQADRRTSLTLPDGITVSDGYDPNGNLTGLTYSLSGTTLGDLQYGYDANGQRTQIGGSWARTTLPTAITGNSYNADNQLTSWNSATLTYDANGNLISDGTTTYSWDARNQLSSLSGPTDASFTYDGFGRRTSSTVGGTTTDELYDGENLVQELAGSTPTANLLTGLGIDEVFSRTDSSGTSSFLTDALGSTLALADGSGTVQTSYTYDPFGNPSSTGTSSSNTQQYTGRETDGTGLQYNRARYYSPTLQRFISEDPLGFGGGDANLYAYVGNDPINATDPSGQFIELAGQCLVGAAINIGFGYATSSLAGRKYTWGAAAGDAAIGCALAVVDPFAVVGEGSALVGDVVADDGVAVAGGASSSLASGGEEAAVSDAAAGTCSFSGDTPVATRSGETPIDQLQPGDQVEAYDPATGETGPQPITAVWQHTDQVIEDVTVDGDAIETTPEHPFAVVGTGWVPAGALWVGAQVRREDGSVAVVQTISFAQQSQEMYNLTVATAHTFFVGQQRVLVHNTCDFIVTPNGEAIPVPDGATGPTITKNGKGFMFEGGSGGKGMDPRTVNIRVMDPNPQNPNGYVNYGNNAWQAVDRWTGKTISTKSPLWHISLK